MDDPEKVGELIKHWDGQGLTVSQSTFLFFFIFVLLYFYMYLKGTNS